MRYIQSFQNDAAIQGAVDSNILGHPYIALNDQTGKIDWNEKEETPDYSKMYLTIEALSGGTFYVRKANIGYSVNGAAWETTTGETALVMNQGDAVRFRHVSTALGQLDGCFSENTIQFVAFGNIESLEYGDDFIGKTSVKIDGNEWGDGAFNYLFKYSRNLMSIENLKLPATELKRGAYNGMFMGCASLTTMIELPATVLVSNCYANMFYECSSLRETTPLPGNIDTMSAQNSCLSMFSFCTSLNKVICLSPLSDPNDLWSYMPTISWLENVSTTGTFYKNPNANWGQPGEVIDWGVPSGWTIVDYQG